MNSPHLRITFLYLVAGLCWIVASDLVVSSLNTSVETMRHYQTLKGLIYVAMTGGLLYCLIRSWHERVLEKERAKEEVFRAMSQGMNHILRNFLNNVQHLRLVAEDSTDIDRETIALYDRVIQDTVRRIEQVTNLESASADEIRRHSMN